MKYTEEKIYNFIHFFLFLFLIIYFLILVQIYSIKFSIVTFFVDCYKVCLTKNFNMKKYTTHFKIDCLGYVEAIDLKGTPIVYTLSKASNLIVFPYFATISVLLCCPLVAIICPHSSITGFINGSNSCSIPWTCLPPFNFSDKFLLTWKGELCAWCLFGELKDAFHFNHF